MPEPRYPDAFPHPLRDTYSFSVDMGVIRTAMESGAPRQRRRYSVMPHYFALEFVVSIEALDTWQQWVNDYAYEWFELPLVNYITIGESLCENYCLVRFTSDLAFSVLTEKFMRVAVDAELMPGQVNNNQSRGEWIIGRTPADPSPDWVIGGTPSDPSANWTIPV